LSLQRQALLCVVLLILWQTVSGTAAAQTPARLTHEIDDSQVVRVEHSTHPLVKRASEAGRVENDKQLERMILLLSPSDAQKNELRQFLADVTNRSSTNYHHWLTPAQFGARFGAADGDMQTVREWLERSGFQVAKAEQSKKWLEFSGTASRVEAAFHTELHYYLVNGKKHLANSEDISLPAELAKISPGISSLNSFGKISPRHIFGGLAGRNAQGEKVRMLTPSLTAAGGNNSFIYYLAPGDFSNIYNTGGLLSAGVDGTGVSIAVLAQSNVELSDIQMFRQVFGLKANDPNIILSGPDPGIANPTDAEEAMLDAEWAGAVAPGATINLVVAGTTETTNGVDLAAEYAIENEVAPIVTYTYGTCEQVLGTAGNAFYNALWRQAAAQGITVLVATGDNGATGCDDPNGGVAATQGFAVSGTASTPYNVAVGGTEFNEGSTPATYWNATNNATFTSAVGYIPEAVWNESCDPGQIASATNCAFGSSFSLLAGGGGVSTVYTKPSWQTGKGVPADGQRDVPDVALAASANHDDIVYCTSLGGTACQVDSQQGVVGLTLVGGTSAATPAMAGILALVEQKNGTYQGQIDNVLYKLAQSNSCEASKQTNPSTQNTCIFYDVTSGGNAVPCAGGTPGCSSAQAGTNGITPGQSAGPGYDLATGLGSVNATNLANAWKNSTLSTSLTTLQLANATFVHGTAVSLNGTVAAISGTGTPSGIVGLKTDTYGNLPDTLAITAGVFTGSISDLPGGQYNLSAHYAGDGTFAASDSTPVAVNVTAEGSITTVSLNGVLNGTLSYGSTFSIVVKVAGLSGMGAATGTVTLQDGANSLGTFALSTDGEATIPGGGSGISFAPGAHTLSAIYAGDNSFTPSTSSAVAFTVGQGTPFVVVGLNSNSVAAGQTVAVHVAVSGFGSAAPTGTIQITDNGVAVGPMIALQTGGFFGTGAQASSLLTNLDAGTHTIGANYNANGDPNYTSVASGDPRNEISPLPTVTVGATAGTKTTTTLAATKAPANLGDTASFAVTISPAAATGTVTLWDAVGPRSAAVAIAGGAASISIPWPQGGTDAVYAMYSGDAGDAQSTSNSVSFTVARGVPVVNLAAPTTASETQQVSLNASVTGIPGNPVLAYPTGIVEFWDSVNGATAQILGVQVLTAGAGNIAVYAARLRFTGGTHTLHAHYRGDNNWMPADSPNVALAASDFTVAVTPNPISFAGGNAGTGTVTLTQLDGFTGPVTLTCATGGTAPPAGYTCSLAASVTMSGAAATTPLTLGLAATNTMSGMKVASNGEGSPQLWLLGMVGGAALLGLAFGAMSGSGTSTSRNFACFAGLVLCTVGFVWGCGGGGGSSGGGGGGGPVATTTTLASSNLKIGFGTPVQFNVTVNASVTPSGRVQLTDNGQAFGSAVPVSAGIATFGTSNLPVGVHVLMAQYQGDASTKASSSAPITEIVTGSVPLQVTAASSSGISHTSNVTIMVN
jgi:hypothetical protein